MAKHIIVEDLSKDFVPNTQKQIDETTNDDSFIEDVFHRLKIVLVHIKEDLLEIMGWMLIPLIIQLAIRILVDAVSSTPASESLIVKEGFSLITYAITVLYMYYNTFKIKKYWKSAVAAQASVFALYCGLLWLIFNGSQPAIARNFFYISAIAIIISLTLVTNKQINRYIKNNKEN